jgi:hypothetical protein
MAADRSKEPYMMKMADSKTVQRLRSGVVASAIMLAAVLAAGVTTLSAPAALAQEQDMTRLQDQLRDCRGDDCVPIRDRMMIQLRDQLQSCAGGQCDQLRDRLRLHERVQDCHQSDRGCRELRMQEREQVRSRYQYGTGRGMGPGMGGGQGRGGMGN